MNLGQQLVTKFKTSALFEFSHCTFYQGNSCIKVLGMARVVKEWRDLTEAQRNEEHNRANIKDVFTSRIRRTRDSLEQINPRSKQGNIDICASAQPQIYMVGKCEPQYSGEPKNYMNMSRNNNQKSEFQLCEYNHSNELEPERSPSNKGLKR